jgi:peptidoglycan-associated lipoprotein
MNRKNLAAVTVAVICSFGWGCAKKVAVAHPNAPTPTTAAVNKPAPTPAPARQQPVQTASTPKSNMPDQGTRDQIQALLNRIQDAYFDYNTGNLRPDAETALRADSKTLAAILRQYPDYKLTVEGYCDERGSEEYNLGLGEERARRAKQYLVDSGIPTTQLLTVSFGKNRPVCEQHDESCWQKNRRVHITQAQNQTQAQK